MALNGAGCSDLMSIFETYCFVNPQQVNKRYKISLEERGLLVINEKSDSKSTLIVQYEDIIGIEHCAVSDCTNSTNGEDTGHILNVYSLPSTSKGLFGSKKTRKRSCLSLRLHDFSPSSKAAEAMEYVIQKVHSRIATHSSQDVVRFSKKVMVLVNPASGRGVATKLLGEKVVPLFDEAKLDYEIVETKRAGHGKQIAQNIRLDEFYGIIILSGDGLLYEVFQGLMAREDWEEAIKLPIGMLPGGSGNGLCCSINYAAREVFKSDILVHSLYVVLKHKITPIDLVQVDTVSGPVYSFLSITWGFIADVDIESERFRKLGNARFTVEAIARILNPRTYRGKLYLKPVSGYKPKQRTKSDMNIVVNEQNGSSSRSRSKSMPFSGLHGASSNGADDSEADGCNGDLFEASSPGSTSDNNPPPLDSDVPADWVVIDGPFATIAATYQTHIGPDMMVAPSAMMDDGIIYLLIVRQPITRLQSLNLMKQLEDGSHVRNPIADLIPVTAFRLVPEQPKGNIVVDGELIDYGPIQAQVLPRAARIMAI